MDAQSIAKRFGGFDPRWLALCVTAIGSFMSILDSTVVKIQPDITVRLSVPVRHV